MFTKSVKLNKNNILKSPWYVRRAVRSVSRKSMPHLSQENEAACETHKKVEKKTIELWSGVVPHYGWGKKTRITLKDVAVTYISNALKFNVRNEVPSRCQIRTRKICDNKTFEGKRDRKREGERGRGREREAKREEKR